MIDGDSVGKQTVCSDASVEINGDLNGHYYARRERERFNSCMSLVVSLQISPYHRAPVTQDVEGCTRPMTM